MLSFGPWSSSSFDRSYGSRGWCCTVVTCQNNIKCYPLYYFIALTSLDLSFLTWPPAVRWASISVSFPGPPTGPTLDSVVFFFLPRLEGAGITTTWEVPSPSFLSTKQSAAAGQEERTQLELNSKRSLQDSFRCPVIRHDIWWYNHVDPGLFMFLITETTLIVSAFSISWIMSFNN